MDDPFHAPVVVRCFRSQPLPPNLAYKVFESLLCLLMILPSQNTQISSIMMESGIASTQYTQNFVDTVKLSLRSPLAG